MRVSIAAQVFSHRVASTMRLMADFAPQNTLSNAKGTANLCMFMDLLFDSVNGSTIRSVDGKPLKCAIKDGSSHIAFWHEAIKVLESMRFVNKTSGQTVKQPVCIKGYLPVCALPAALRLQYALYRVFPPYNYISFIDNIFK